jgi:MFS transporter, DHA2 family, metal-tetracycline-proton antiporter
VPPESTTDQKPASSTLFLTVLVAAILNAVLTGSMVNVLLSNIRESFDISTARVSWAIAAYSLAYAVGIPLYGRISDFLGTRNLFTLGVLGFALGGLMCAIAPNFPLLIVGRLFQGAGGAAVPALAMVMISRVMAPDRRGGAMGLIGSAVGIGQATGPLVGGFIGGSIGWRFLFLVPAAISIVIVVLSQRTLPNTKLTTERRFDIIGGTLLGLATGFFLFGITQGQSSGYTSAIVLGSFGGSAVATGLFVWRINAVPFPFAPPALFGNSPYVRMLLVGTFNMMSYLSMVILVPLMLIEHNGMTPSEAGLAITPGAIAMAFVSRLAGRISDRIGGRVPVLLGLTTMLVAGIFLSTVAAGGGLWVVATGVAIFGIGSAMINAPLNSTVSRLLSAQDTGIGMGLFSGAAFLGGGVGAAITGAWLNARQTADAGALNPLYTGDAIPWSDGFLAVIVMVALALVLAVTIPFDRPGDSTFA